MPTTIPTTTSSTRPGSPSAGDAYFETDTKNYIIYDGANWRGYASDGVRYLWSGQNRYAIEFDGTNDSVTVGNVDESAFNIGTQDFAISMWVNFTSLNASNYRSLFGRNTSGTSWRVYARADGLSFFTGSTLYTGADTLTTSTWYNLIVTRTGGNLSMYVGDGASNPTQVYNASNSVNIPFGSNITCRFGEDTSNTDFHGKITDVGYWIGSGLTQSQVNNIYKGESDGGSGGTFGKPGDLSSFNPDHWWRFGDNIGGSGTVLQDSQLPNINGALINNASYVAIGSGESVYV